MNAYTTLHTYEVDKDGKVIECAIFYAVADPPRVYFSCAYRQKSPMELFCCYY